MKKNGNMRLSKASNLAVLLPDGSKFEVKSKSDKLSKSEGIKGPSGFYMILEYAILCALLFDEEGSLDKLVSDVKTQMNEKNIIRGR